jgi:tape measure domain-containing protein
MGNDVDIRVGGNKDDLTKILSQAGKDISSFVKQIQSTFSKVDLFKEANKNIITFSRQIKDLRTDQLALNKTFTQAREASKAAQAGYKGSLEATTKLEKKIKDLNKVVAENRKTIRTSADRKAYIEQGGDVDALKTKIKSLVAQRDKDKASLLESQAATRSNRETMRLANNELKTATTAQQANIKQIQSGIAQRERWLKISRDNREALKAEGVDTRKLVAERERLIRSIDRANAQSRGRQRIASAKTTLGIDSGNVDREIVRVQAAFNRLRNSGTLSANEIARAYAAANSRIKELRGNASGTRSVFSGLTSTFASFFAVTQAFRAGASFVGLVDEFKSITAQVKIATRSEEEFNVAQKEVFEIAKATRTPLNDTAKLYGRIARATKKLNIEQKDQFDTVSIVNKAILTSGANAREAEAAVIQLGQALASGRLSGDELRSIAEQTPRVAQAIAEGLGLPIGALKELGKQGKLTAEVVIESLLTQKDVIDAEFKELPVTVAQSLSNLKTEFTQFAGDFEKRTKFTENLAKGINGIAARLPTIINAFITLGKIATAVFAGSLIKAFIARLAAMKVAILANAAAFRTMGLAANGMFGIFGQLIATIAVLAAAFIDFGDDAAEAAERIEASKKKVDEALESYKKLSSEQAKQTRREQLSAKQVGLAKKYNEDAEALRKLNERLSEQIRFDARNTKSAGLNFRTRALAEQAEEATDKLAELKLELDNVGSLVEKIFEEDKKQNGLNDLISKTVTLPEGFDKKVLARIESIQNAIKGFSAGIAKKTATSVSEVLESVDLRFKKLNDNINKETKALQENIIKIELTGRKNKEADLKAARTALEILETEKKKLATIISQTKEKEKQDFIANEKKSLTNSAEKLRSLDSQIQNVFASIATKSANTVNEVIDGVAAKYKNLSDKAANLVAELKTVAGIADSSGSLTESDKQGANARVIDAEAAQEEINLLTEQATVLELVKNLKKELTRLTSEQNAFIQEQEALVATGSITQIEAQENIRVKTQETTDEMIRLKEETQEAIAGFVGTAEAAKLLDKATISVKSLTKQQQLANQVNQEFANGLTTAITDFVSGTLSAKDAFKKFAAEFLKKIAQMILQQTILNAIGGGGGIGGAVASVGSNHSGGMAGTGSKRLVDPSIFFAAPRYHTGGIAGLAPNEVPSILKKDEEVLTSDDPRHRNNQSGLENLQLNVINAIDSGSVVEEGLSTPAGSRSILNVLASNKASVKALLL